MVMAASALFWGYIVASMASIISSFSAQSEKAEQFMEQITHYLKSKNYPTTLTRKIQRYYRHYYYKEHATDELEFMENLSPTLQNEVSTFLLHNVKGRILTGIAIFDELNRRELSMLTMIMKPQFFEAGACVCATAARLQQMFFIISGDLFVLSPASPDMPVSSIDLTAAYAEFKAESIKLLGNDVLTQSDSTAATTVADRLSRVGPQDERIRWKLLPPGNCFGAYEALSLKEARLPILSTSASDLFAISRKDLDNCFGLHPEVLSNIINQVELEYARWLALFRDSHVEPESGPSCCCCRCVCCLSVCPSCFFFFFFCQA